MRALKGLIDKIEHPKKSAAESLAVNHKSPPRRLDERDIYRYRRQRGVNLGSWFVLERWISEDPFHNAVGPASSDYDVACSCGAREALERHWDTWITDEDWLWISERGINSVRLPIGYYHLYAIDPSVVEGTPFYNLGKIFEGAWRRIMEAINKASSYGIGVLIDLHSAPGKQNADAHSGINGPVEFYKQANLSRTLHVLLLLAATFKDTPNVVGIQLVNEPQNHSSLLGWYKSALDSIRAAVGPDLPLYIHDAWNTHQYASLVKARSDFVVLDHHLYRCFTSQDQTLSGDQHASALPREEFARYAETTRGNFVVAEFSAALNPNSMGASDTGEQDRQRRVFARAELDMFDHCCGGWWMWTYKRDRWDAGWSLRDTVRAEIMPGWLGIHKGTRGENDQRTRDEQASNALDQHTRYWSAHKGTYEHWRFETGFKQGWNDAFLFFCFSPNTVVEAAVSELGFIDQWLKRRSVEHASDHGTDKNMWEFEHGFRQGADAATRLYKGI